MARTLGVHAAGLLWWLLLAPAGPAWSQEELFVTNSDGNSLTVHPRTAAGNVAPTRTLAGGATGLAGPVAVLVDTARDELVVLNASGGGSITVYARGAGGDAAPLR